MMFGQKLVYGLIIITLFQFCQCTYAQKQGQENSLPNWVHHPHEIYPEAMYIVGVGSGDTRSDAENNAIGSIAKVFQSDIKVDETLIEKYVESDESASFTSQMLNRTAVGSRQNLKNITIDKSYFSERDGLYYVLAYLDRMKTEEVYREDIEKNYASVERFHANYRESDDKLHRFTFLQKAIDVMQITEVLQDQYQIINVSGQQIEPPMPLSLLQKEKKELLNNISVTLMGEGNYQNEIADYIKETVGKIGSVITEHNADFNFNYELDVSPANLNRNDVVGYNWKLTLEVFDNINDQALKAFNIKNRTMGISEDQAKAKMMLIIQDKLNKDFYNQFMEYISAI